MMQHGGHDVMDTILFPSSVFLSRSAISKRVAFRDQKRYNTSASEGVQ